MSRRFLSTHKQSHRFAKRKNEPKRRQRRPKESKPRLVCEICLMPKAKLVPQTGICFKCNAGINMFDGIVSRIRRAADYRAAERAENT